jgi:hypothetical protein
MVELLRTNDIVLISRIEALMAEHEIPVLVADQYMSAVEGSLGFLPRRMLIDADHLNRARMAMHSAGLMSALQRP